MKRIIVVLFAVSVFVPNAVFAKAAYPTWVDAAWREGKRCKRWEPLFQRHGLPVIPFSYLSWREARCKADVVNARWRDGKLVWTLNRNGTYDSGLLQVNSSWVTVTAEVCGSKRGDLSVLRQPGCNVAVAAYLYANGGFGHWGW